MTPTPTDHERQIGQRVSEWTGPSRLHELNAERLCELSMSEGVDFATALLYRAICTSADHGPFVQRLKGLLRDRSPAAPIEAMLAIAPGAFYREHPETGADGRRLCEKAASLGCRTHVIPTQSLGSAAENGRIIHEWLLSASHENVVLCSLSKGGADVKMALAESNAERAFRNVVAWLNVGGITAGSPMATWVLDRRWLAMIYRALFWLRGQNFRFVQSLARRRGSPLDFQISAPAGMKILHVVGFPLACHLRRRRSQRWHQRLAAFGPNDGATILADSCSMPGLIFPVWGADHYLDAGQSPEILLAALLRYLADELQLSSAHVNATSLTS